MPDEIFLRLPTALIAETSREASGDDEMMAEARRRCAGPYRLSRAYDLSRETRLLRRHEYSRRSARTRSKNCLTRK